MKKPAILVVSAIGIFLLGCLFGEIKSTETWSEILSFQQEIELEREAGKAFEAYKKENQAVGIYSLRELLDEIDHRQEIIGAEENESMFTFYRIQTHLRLSRLYAAAGKEEKSEIHRMKALSITEQNEDFKGLFSEKSFDDLVDYFDSKETENENQAREATP